MLAIIGLIIGIVLGVFLNIDIPDKFSPYISVAIFACLDSVFGAIKSVLMKKFRTDIFLSGFFGNSVLAVILAYIGDKLGIPIYLAAVIVFGSRIFDNFSTIRRMLLEKARIHQ